MVPGMGLQCMRFTRVSASIKTAFAFSLVGGHNACLSASVKTTSAFSLVWRQTRLIIGLDGFCVFFGIASQCTRFKCVSASKTAFSFSFVWRYNICVSHACLHRLRLFLRFPSYGDKMYAFHTRVCIG